MPIRKDVREREGKPEKLQETEKECDSVCDGIYLRGVDTEVMWLLGLNPESLQQDDQTSDIYTTKDIICDQLCYQFKPYMQYTQDRTTI